MVAIFGYKENFFQNIAAVFIICCPVKIHQPFFVKIVVEAKVSTCNRLSGVFGFTGCQVAVFLCLRLLIGWFQAIDVMGGTEAELPLKVPGEVRRQAIADQIGDFVDLMVAFGEQFGAAF